MAQKRPFDEEVVEQNSAKHQRQDGPSGEINLGESSIGKDELGLRREHENGSCPVISKDVVEDVDNDVPRSASLSHWATSSISDEEEMPEEVVQLPFYPGYFSFEHPVRPVRNTDDVYYCLLDYPPRKRIPVGPDHQAEIPSWGSENSSHGLGTFETAESDKNSVGIVESNLNGICIIPLPKTESSPYNGEKVGDGRAECTCSDHGSIRCVRQHIAEARDKLRRTLGQDTFMELGFYDMGEVVAERWSEEEQQLFHEVVFSNPASLGKNFWNVLSAVFHSRTKMEIVSYYFNVFMLKIRAEQNRCDPMNIDSDNDEWHGSDDDGGDGGVSDEDEDSGIESPVHHDGPELHQNVLLLHEDDHEPEDDGDFSDEAQENFGSSGDVIVRKSDFSSGFDLSCKNSDDDRENDVQDGSCTSSDSGGPAHEPRLKPDGCHEWNDYIMDSSDAKAWDGYSMSCPKQNVDFLPTCSMIEEVFGDCDFDSKSKRW